MPVNRAGQSATGQRRGTEATGSRSFGSSRGVTVPHGGRRDPVASVIPLRIYAPKPLAFIR